LISVHFHFGKTSATRAPQTEHLMRQIWHSTSTRFSP